MKRFLRALGRSATFLLVMGGGISPSFGQDTDRPNVLMIAVDDLAATLGCYGDRLAQTPHIDRLASQGVCFLRAYNQLPLCNPTRASLMTGLRPDRLQVYDLDRHFREALPEVVTIPQALMPRGYRSIRVGKIYHYNVPASIGTDGFDDPPSWHERYNPYGRDKDEEELVFNAEPHRKISAALSWHAAAGASEEQTDGLSTSQAIRLLERQKKDGSPFFLAVGFFRPHTPFVAPKQFFDLYPLESMRLPFAPEGDREDVPVAGFAHNCPIPHYGLDLEVCLRAMQAYYACVSFIDAQVGRLLDALEQLALKESTIVVFWSDHGYHLGEHEGIWQKRTLFEESARAPFIISAPGQSGNGQVCRRIIEFVDLYPTLMELTHTTGPSGLDGRSLMPLLEDPLAEWDGAAVTQILRPADERLPQPVMGRSIRTERWRYTEWDEGEAGVELYDHRADPQEFRNLGRDPDPDLEKVRHGLRSAMQEKALGRAPRSPFNPKRL